MSELKGTVKFYNSSKGFGFLVDNQTQNEYFVHATGLVDNIQESDEVIFDLVEGKRGLMATNVKVI